MADEISFPELGLDGLGIVVQTGAESFVERAIAAGSNKVTVQNGTGVGGNPIIDIAPANITLPSTANVTGLDAALNSKANINNDVNFANITATNASISDSVITAQNSAANVVSYSFQVKNSASNYFNAGFIQAQATNTTAGAEASKLNFYTYNSGSADVAFVIDTTGGSKLTGDLEITGNADVTTLTSGAATFNSSAKFTSSAFPYYSFAYENLSPDSTGIAHVYYMLDSAGNKRTYAAIEISPFVKTSTGIEGTILLEARGATYEALLIGAGSCVLYNMPLSFNGSTANGIQTLINCTLLQPVDISDATLTLNSNHNYKTIYFNGACTVTIPADLPTTFCCALVQAGTGTVTVANGAGVTIFNRWGAYKTGGEGARMIINRYPTVLSVQKYLIDGDVII